MCQLNSIVKGQAPYPVLYFILPVLVGAVLPHLVFVVHATYAVEFDIELFGLPLYRPDIDFRFFTCAKTFSTGTRLLLCALFCAFLVAVSFLSLGFLCGIFAFTPQR